jgi:hypothetical protein
MFTAQRIEFARHKERLIAQAQRDREAVAVIGSRLERPFALADNAVEVGHYLKSHPFTVVAGAATAGLVGRRHLWRVARWSVKLMWMWRTVSPWIREYKK